MAVLRRDDGVARSVRACVVEAGAANVALPARRVFVAGVEGVGGGRALRPSPHGVVTAVGRVVVWDAYVVCGAGAVPSDGG